jgi:hypothetical protein
VKKILRGQQREQTTHFIVFRSHWRFESEFCTPAQPHEKGGIEGEAGYFRRNHWVPLPQARDLEELNAQLLAACHEDERRVIAGHDTTVGAAMVAERTQLLSLAEQDFELTEGIVSAGGRARLRESTDQSVFGAGAARQNGRGAALSESR